MRTVTTVLAALLLLAAVPAVAKEVRSASVCGADGCSPITEGHEGMLGGAPALKGPTAAEPFVRLRFAFAEPGSDRRVTVRNVFLPKSGLLLADDGTWMLPGDVAALRRIARTVEPLPASRMPGAVQPAPPAPVPPAAAPEPADDGGFPWWIALVAVPLAAAALLARRLRGGALRTG